MTTQSGFIPPLSQNVPIVDRNGNPTFEFMLKFNKQNALNAGIPSTSALMSAALDLIGDTKGDLLVRDTLLWTPFHAGADGSILRTHGAGTLPSWDTISTILDTVSNTQGSVLYRGSAGWNALGPGTSGQFLKTLGTAANPAWAAVPAGVTAANPTATASDTAVNGSSANFMRADAAPAIQLATTGQFGLVKPDGSTITISAGVISSVGGGLSAIADNSCLANLSGGSAVPVAHTLDDILAYGAGYTFYSAGGVLQIAQSDTSVNFRAELYNSSSAGGAALTMVTGSGSRASAGPPANGQVVGTVRWAPALSTSGGVATVVTSAEIRAVAKEPAFGTTKRGAFIDFGMPKLGTSTIVRVFKIDADDGLTTNGVNWLTAAGVLKASALDTPYPAGANPSATASDTAVNGTSGSFMRADASPAIQKASTSQFGVAKADGVTVVASGGVLSAVAGGLFAGFDIFAFHPAYYSGLTPTVGVSLPANGGAIVFPVRVNALMELQSLTFHSTDTSAARSMEWGLFVDSNSGVTVSEITGAAGTLSFTPAAASNREAAATGAPVALLPGIYWAVIRNTSTTATLSVGFGTVTSTLGNVFYKTKTLVAALGSTLDIDTGWSAGLTSVPGVFLNGRVLGKSTAWA